MGRSHKRKHHNDDVYIRPLQYFYCKAGKSVRRLVLLAMKKYVNVRLASFFSGVRIRLGTILGRFSIIFFRGLGLRIRVRVWVRVSVVLWSG